jgi:hypothetical protein
MKETMLNKSGKLLAAKESVFIRKTYNTTSVSAFTGATGCRNIGR